MTAQLSPLKPFERRHLTTTDDIISVRLSPKDRERIDAMRSVLAIEGDSTILKLGLETMQNVIQGTFGTAAMRRLCSQRRVRDGKYAAIRGDL